MAQIIDNKKGFKVIQIGRDDLVRTLAAFGSSGICDRCCKSPNTGYYIAVLNMWFCPECYNKWIANATRYDEDKEVEERNFNFYKSLFGG